MTGMKKFLVLVSLLSTMAVNSFAQFAVLDMANLVNGIEQLYQTYQQITNAIEQVQNTYKQIEQAAQQVMSMDWSNLSNLGDNFAGMAENPFEVITGVRNSAQDIIKEVNRKMNDWNRLSDLLTKDSISFGTGDYKMSVSVADLVGAGDPDKDANAFMENAWTYISKTGERMAEGYEGKLTPEQKRAIMSQYGMSSRNYAQLQFANYQLDNLVTESNVKGTAQAIADTSAQQLAKVDTLKMIIQNTPEGSMKAAVEASAMVEVEALLQMQTLSTDLQRFMTLYSQYISADKAQELQMRVEEMRKAEEAAKATESTSGKSFDNNL